MVGKVREAKGPKTSYFDYHSQTWTRPKGRPYMPGLVIYASVDGGFAVWDPARNYWRDPDSGKKETESQPRAYQFTPDSLANGLKDGDRVLCNGLIQDWVNWYFERSALGSAHVARGGSFNSSSKSINNLFTFSPFNYLEKVINVISHPSEKLRCEEPRKVFVDDTRKFPMLGMPYGVVPYPQWSAGVKRILSFAYLIVWTWIEHLQAAELRNEDPTDRIILIIDEIEAHLHPKWQRTILPAILNVVEKLRSDIEVQVFSATHSPLVLASLEPHFDKETDQLFSFNLDKNKVTFDNLPWAMHGDMVAWLTSNIFGLEQARSREAERAIESAEAFIRGDKKELPEDLKTKEALTKELKRVLPSLDPFWPRWIIEGKL